MILITTGKKSSSRDRCYDQKKKVLAVYLVGAGSLLRPEKKSSSRDFYAKLNVTNLNVTNFVLVLVRIDPIHSEHSICISST